jgi:hypothetical protein
MKELIEKARQYLGARRYAYRSTFKGPLAEVVLRDLARFCHANKSTFHEDKGVQAMLDGRREAWLRIQQHLQMTEDDLWQLLDGRAT